MEWSSVHGGRANVHLCAVHGDHAELQCLSRVLPFRWVGLKNEQTVSDSGRLVLLPLYSKWFICITLDYNVNYMV